MYTNDCQCLCLPSRNRETPPPPCLDDGTPLLEGMPVRCVKYHTGLVLGALYIIVKCKATTEEGQEAGGVEIVPMEGGDVLTISRREAIMVLASKRVLSLRDCIGCHYTTEDPIVVILTSNITDAVWHACQQLGDRVTVLIRMCGCQPSPHIRRYTQGLCGASATDRRR